MEVITTQNHQPHLAPIGAFIFKMNWKQKYTQIKRGDKVRLLFLDEMDSTLDVTEEDIGKIFTVFNVSSESIVGGITGGFSYCMEEHKKGSRYLFYHNQLEKVIQ